MIFRIKKKKQKEMKVKNDQQVLDSIEKLQDTQLFGMKKLIQKALDQKDSDSIKRLHEINDKNNLTIKNLVSVSMVLKSKLQFIAYQE